MRGQAQIQSRCSGGPWGRGRGLHFLTSHTDTDTQDDAFSQRRKELRYLLTFADEAHAKQVASDLQNTPEGTLTIFDSCNDGTEGVVMCVG
jgi:hypothetical protein